MIDVIQLIIDNIQTIAIVTVPIVAGFGLGFTVMQLKKQQETRELELIENIMKNLNYMNDRIADRDKTWTKEELRVWDIQFMNELEWLCFLFNEEKIKDKKLKKYWISAIKDWHDEIYLKHFEQKEIDDPKHYLEVKKFLREN